MLEENSSWQLVTGTAEDRSLRGPIFIYLDPASSISFFTICEPEYIGPLNCRSSAVPACVGIKLEAWPSK